MTFYVGISTVWFAVSGATARVTQVFAEVLINQPLPSTARVSQVFIEVLVQ